MENKTISIVMKKSSIGATERQKRTFIALGLKHLHQEVKLPANPAVLGMISKIQRWVVVK